MADFDKYAPRLKKLEGGWSNSKYDRGGATMCGVTLAVFRSFFGNERTKEDLHNITEDQWRTVMKSYWDRCKGDQIFNQSIAELFVDWHVNAGVNGIKAMQRACMLTADGIVGPRTLAVLNSPNAEVIFNRIKDARISYYRKLALGNPSQNVHLNGWLNRTDSFKFAER